MCHLVTIRTKQNEISFIVGATVSNRLDMVHLASVICLVLVWQSPSTYCALIMECGIQVVFVSYLLLYRIPFPDSLVAL